MENNTKKEIGLIHRYMMVFMPLLSFIATWGVKGLLPVDADDPYADAYYSIISLAHIAMILTVIFSGLVTTSSATFLLNQNHEKSEPFNKRTKDYANITMIFALLFCGCNLLIAIDADPANIALNTSGLAAGTFFTYFLSKMAMAINQTFFTIKN